MVRVEANHVKPCARFHIDLLEAGIAVAQLVEQPPRAVRVEPELPVLLNEAVERHGIDRGPTRQRQQPEINGVGSNVSSSARRIGNVDETGLLLRVGVVPQLKKRKPSSNRGRAR